MRGEKTGDSGENEPVNTILPEGLPTQENRAAKNGQIRSKAERARGSKPVKKHIVRSIKPWFITPEGRIIIFRKDVNETFLPPAKNRPLLQALDSHLPNGQTPLYHRVTNHVYKSRQSPA